MPRKVLHIRCSGGFLGAENVVIELARHAQEFGYEPALCVPYDRGEANPELVIVAQEHGIATHALPCRHRLDPGALRQLRRLAAAWAVDIVHTHGYREDIYAALALWDLPLVATNHNWLRCTRRLRLYARLDAWVLRRFDRIVAVSEPVLSDLLKAGLPRHKLLHIANGVEADRFFPWGSHRALVQREFAIPEDAPLFGMVSSLRTLKGHRYAFEALARLEDPRTHLLIVGAGPEAAALREQAAGLGLGARVRFAGGRSDIPVLLSALDGFLLPSLVEGLPMALLEAMAAGVPAIASRVGDVATVVEDGRSGLLVPPGESAALAAAMARLLAAPEQARIMGKNGRRRVREHFSSRAMTRAYCSLYDHCLFSATQTEEA